MKKLVYLAAVALVASMAACGNSEKAQEEAAAAAEEAPVVEEVVEAVADSVAPDTVAVAVEGVEAVEAPAQ